MTASKENEKVLKTLKEGDIVKITRNSSGFEPYSHHVVYVGDGDVVHLVPSLNQSVAISSTSSFSGTSRSTNQQLGNVTRSSLLTVANNDTISVANSFSPVKSGAEIAKSAISKIGEHKYNLVTYNCEHFAHDMAYDKPRSLQVEEAATAVKDFVVKKLGL